METLSTPSELIEAIETHYWRTAKAKANPHSYTLRHNWKSAFTFNQFIMYIKQHGVKTKFWNRDYIILKIGTYSYWTMEACYYSEEKLLSDTILINRRNDTTTDNGLFKDQL